MSSALAGVSLKDTGATMKTVNKIQSALENLESDVLGVIEEHTGNTDHWEDACIDELEAVFVPLEDIQDTLEEAKTVVAQLSDELSEADGLCWDKNGHLDEAQSMATIAFFGFRQAKEQIEAAFNFLYSYRDGMQRVVRRLQCGWEMMHDAAYFEYSEEA